MTAHLDIAWETQNESCVFFTAVAQQTHPTLTRQLAAARQPAHCPSCSSIVYSRRHKLCGVCGEPLPNVMLFTPQESHRIEALISTERLRHRQWLQQRAF